MSGNDENFGDWLVGAVLVGLGALIARAFRVPRTVLSTALLVLWFHPWNTTVGEAVGSLLILALLLLPVALACWFVPPLRRAVLWCLPPQDFAKYRSSRTVVMVDPQDRALARTLRKFWEAGCVRLGLSVQVGENKHGNPVWEHARLVSITSSPLGAEVLVRPVSGRTVEEVVRAAPGLASWFKVREVRAESVSGFEARLWFVVRDPLSGTRDAQVPHGSPEGWTE